MTETQHVDSSPSALNVASRGELEADCIDLLCKQEQWLSMLDETNQRSHVAEALQFAKQMLVEFLEFAEKHFDDLEFAEVAKQVNAVFVSTKELEAVFNQQTWENVKRLFGMSGKSKFELNEAHQKVGDEYAALYTHFFARCVKRFTSGVTHQKEFLQSVETFLDEFKRKW